VTGGGTTLDITGGKVTIKSNGSTYELTFDCTAADGKNITGYYKGSLGYYVISDLLRSARINNFHKHKW